ncbi:hypothetical protein GAY31_11425 [Azospirillum brasilense]|nr:hypothetical protein [Azospirillum brasilense]
MMNVTTMIELLHAFETVKASSLEPADKLALVRDLKNAIPGPLMVGSFGATASVLEKTFTHYISTATVEGKKDDKKASRSITRQ